MAPSTTAPAFEPIASVDTSKQSPQPIAKENGNGALPVASEPTQPQKNYHDILAYEDKWIGWDGPVWCNRYGRFENKEQAAEHDGYKAVTHQSTYCSPFQSHLDSIAASLTIPFPDPETQEIHHCQQEGCACRVPFEHRSYVKDIQRRIEPMTASLVALEHRVGQLVHHIAKGGEHAVHDAFHNEDGKERFAMHSASGHHADGPMHAEHFEKHSDPMAETIAKLEGKVHSLTHQLHMLVKRNEELIRNGQVSPAKEEYWQVSQ